MIIKLDDYFTGYYGGVPEWILEMKEELDRIPVYYQWPTNYAREKREYERELAKWWKKVKTAKETRFELAKKLQATIQRKRFSATDKRAVRKVVKLSLHLVQTHRNDYWTCNDHLKVVWQMRSLALRALLAIRDFTKLAAVLTSEYKHDSLGHLEEAINELIIYARKRWQSSPTPLKSIILETQAKLDCLHLYDFSHQAQPGLEDWLNQK